MASCPKCGKRPLRRDPIGFLACRHCGPLSSAIITHSLIGRLRDGAWTIIISGITADFQPSRVCLTSWDELRLVRCTHSKSYSDHAAWKKGVLVGRAADETLNPTAEAS